MYHLWNCGAAYASHVYWDSSSKEGDERRPKSGLMRVPIELKVWACSRKIWNLSLDSEPSATHDGERARGEGLQQDRIGAGCLT